MNYTLSRHARQEMPRRKISQEMVEQVLTRPQQIIPQEPGKKVYQSQLDCGDDFWCGSSWLMTSVRRW